MTIPRTTQVAEIANACGDDQGAAEWSWINKGYRGVGSSRAETGGWPRLLRAQMDLATKMRSKHTPATRFTVLVRADSGGSIRLC